jgi:glutathione S-transferase
MALTLHYHPLSSFCMKVLVGLYELDVPFHGNIVDLGNAESRAAFLALWPIGKFPVLCDDATGLTVPETSIIIEWVDGGRLIPSDANLVRECRLRDRFFDLYVNVPMGKIVTDKLRPVGQRDVYGVEQARAQLETAYAVSDEWLREGGPWAVGEAFTLADCAAAPALFYANKVAPFGDGRPHLAEYFGRLSKRPSFARVLAEAEPYFSMFPG